MSPRKRHARGDHGTHQCHSKGSIHEPGIPGIVALLVEGRCGIVRRRGRCISAMCYLGCGTPCTSSQPSPGLP
jgi:hypothetical protein